MAHGSLLTYVMCGRLTYQSIIVDSVLDYYEGILMTVHLEGHTRSKALVFWCLVHGFLARSAAAFLCVQDICFHRGLLLVYSHQSLECAHS